jgi:hypothetical protein
LAQGRTNALLDVLFRGQSEHDVPEKNCPGWHTTLATMEQQQAAQTKDRTLAPN